MPSICAAPSPAFLADRGLAAFADQIADLAVQAANRVADLVGGLTRGFGQAFHLVSDDGETASRGAGAGGFDGRVEREKLGLLGDRLDRLGDLRDLRQRRRHRAEPVFDAADSFDQFGDMLHRGLHRGARLGDLTDRRRGRRLHRARSAGDVVIRGHHGLGGLLQMSEPLRLGRHAARDFLHIPGDIGKLDPEPADLARELIDQTLALGRGCGGRHGGVLRCQIERRRSGFRLLEQAERRWLFGNHLDRSYLDHCELRLSFLHLCVKSWLKNSSQLLPKWLPNL